jgi:hypothetical protein
VDHRWAHKPTTGRVDESGEVRLTRFREHHLANVDIPRQESGFAVSEIIFPQPPEPVVEA